MNLGKLLIILGLLLIVAGLALTSKTNLFGWFGQLPGDIRISGERYRILIPITSMAIISLILTVLINLFFRK